MTIATLFQYLLFSRKAILRIALCKQAVWIGLLIVLSAGFAREYDGEDLLHEPWHLLIPLAASLATSWILFTLVFLAARRHQVKAGSYWQLYRRFLGLYWMTAPLAWLYAIPVEHFFSAGNATRLNLLFLAVVSVWRVALMIRVVHVWFNPPLGMAFSLVLFFADTVALVLLFLMPLPLMSIMGGIQVSESAAALAAASFLVSYLGAFLWIPLVYLVVWVWNTKDPWRLENLLDEPGTKPTRSLVAFAAALLLVWMAILPITQPKQQLRHEAESLLAAGKISEALTFMSQYEQSDFPPHWDPPPRIPTSNPAPPIMDVVERVVEEPVKPWVWRIYLEKYSWALFNGLRWPEEQELSRLFDLLDKLEEKEKKAIITWVKPRLEFLSHRDGLSPELITRGKALVDSLSEEQQVNWKIYQSDPQPGEPPEPEEDSLPD